MGKKEEKNLESNGKKSVHEKGTRYWKRCFNMMDSFIMNCLLHRFWLLSREFSRSRVFALSAGAQEFFPYSPPHVMDCAQHWATAACASHKLRLLVSARMVLVRIILIIRRS